MGLIRLLIVASVFLAVSVSGQDLIDLPTEAVVFPANEMRQREQLDFRLFPLGWSENGEVLATLVALPNEAADERAWELRVVDLVTDEVLLAETMRHPTSGTINSFWAKHGAFVNDQLAARGIQRGESTVRRFPALLGQYGGDLYEFVLARNYGSEPNFGYEGLSELTLTLIRNGVKSKRILQETWSEWHPLAAGVGGYLESPSGDRIAVILVLVQRGYEGPPHTRRVRLIGSRVGPKF